MLANGGYFCSKEYIRKIFHSWRWSWKKPSYEQLDKYTPENIQYYFGFLEWVSQQEPGRLKFLDEVHFKNKGEFQLDFSDTTDVSKIRAIAPDGVRPSLTRGTHFNLTYSATCLVSLTNEELPLFVTLRKDSNDQVDFIEFLIEAIQNNYIKEGDFVICDNASIHGGLETLETLQFVLDVVGVDMVYLPTYSPELNPAELVFAKTKRWLRENRDQDSPFAVDIAAAFSTVSLSNIKRFYNKCLYINIQ